MRKGLGIFLILCIVLTGYLSLADSMPGFSYDESYDTGLVAGNAGELLTEGDLLVRSNGIREIYGVTGKGVRIGVIGNGVESIRVSEESGELPAVKVLSTGFGDEGTAMLEIIHDIVPDAELYFCSYGNGSVTFKEAVTTLADNGCTIICDDLYFFRQPFLQDGDVANHIRDILKSHPELIYVTVSGNFAMLHYQGDWKPGSSFGEEGRFHEFTPGDDAINITLPEKSRIIATLQWDDPWDASMHDYDLLLTDSQNGEILAASRFQQTGEADPFEHIAYVSEENQPKSVSLQILGKGNMSRSNTLELFIRDVDQANVTDQIVKDPSDSIFGHAAIQEVVTVGSVISGDPYIISPDSSRGPVTIRYPEPNIRLKPDICAPTNVRVSGAGNFPNRFLGTSAAAPHVAGVLALLRSAFPKTSREELIETIYSTAQDLGPTGWDPTYGYGMINAEQAYHLLYNQVSPYY